MLIIVLNGYIICHYFITMAIRGKMARFFIFQMYYFYYFIRTHNAVKLEYFLTWFEQYLFRRKFCYYLNILK